MHYVYAYIAYSERTVNVNCQRAAAGRPRAIVRSQFDVHARQFVFR